MTPERERWTTLCKALDALTGSSLDAAIAAQRAEVLRWPSPERALEADSPWLAGLLEGRFDPRLELAGWATVRHVLERNGAAVVAPPLELVRAFGKHLDPAFDPTDVVLEEEDDIRSASGCGGGRARWVRGSALHQVEFLSNASESPSAGMRSEDRWTAKGLAGGASLTVQVDDFRDGRQLTASGPCPAVLELAPAWTAFVQGGDLAEVSRVLQATRVPWR